MLKIILYRIIVGLCFAVPFGFLGVVSGEAHGRYQAPTGEPLPTDCASCHEDVQSHFAESAHGQAATDPLFRESWQAQGNPASCLTCHTAGVTAQMQPAEGLVCAACHTMGSASSSHPEQVMPTDVSARSCGQCHIDTYAEWETSKHGEGDLNCVRCHSPHTAALKTAGVQALCQSCHNQEGHFYAYTAHAAEGLLCTDCHLRISDSPAGEGHGQRLHVFTVDLATCVECHGEALHNLPAMDEPAGATDLLSQRLPMIEGMAVDNAAAVNPDPEPLNSFSYLLMAAVGLLFGIVAAPWLEELYRRFNNSS